MYAIIEDGSHQFRVREGDRIQVDRRDGKARQAVSVTGGLVHAHTAYRDPKLASLSAEELEQLDSLSRKLALPAPDGPQNQIENTAIEEAEVVSEAAES